MNGGKVKKMNLKKFNNHVFDVIQQLQRIFSFRFIQSKLKDRLGYEK